MCGLACLFILDHQMGHALEPVCMRRYDVRPLVAECSVLVGADGARSDEGVGGAVGRKAEVWMRDVRPICRRVTDRPNESELLRTAREREVMG